MLNPAKVSIKKVEQYHRYLMACSDAYRDWHGENQDFQNVIDMIQWLREGGWFK